MNERIQELALRAFQPINDITTEGVADRRTFDKAWFQHYNEKFAELIIFECTKVAIFKNDGMISTADVAGHIAAGRSIAARMIKEHFGVDE